MSIANVARFVRPADLAEAMAAVLDGAIPVSGGTDVILHPPQQPTDLVDLTALPLSGITGGAPGLRIGATTTLTAMLEDARVAALADGVIRDMLGAVGSPLLRNRATIGGHLARGRLSDVIPLLLALDATITWNDGSEHTRPLAAFYAEGIHRGRIVVTATTIPHLPPQSAAAFCKFSRTAFDLAILNCAARIDLAGDDTIAAARVVIGETPALGASLPDVEVALAGRALDEATIDAAGRMAAEIVPARRDDRASAEYRRNLAAVLVRRCLTEIAGRLS